MGSIRPPHIDVSRAFDWLFNGTLTVTGLLKAHSVELDTDLPISEGGTGASSSAAARTNLGVPGGSGTTNRVARWSDANTLGASVIRDDGSIAGVGIAPVTGANLAVAGGSGGTGGSPVVMGAWAGGAAFTAVALNGSTAAGNYNFVSSGGADQGLYINVPAGHAINLRTGNVQRGTITSTGLSMVGTVTAAGFLVGASAGVDGSFTTVDGKTVTVSKGIITNIT